MSGLWQADDHARSEHRELAEADGNRTRQAELLGLAGFEDRGAHQDAYASALDRTFGRHEARRSVGPVGNRRRRRGHGVDVRLGDGEGVVAGVLVVGTGLVGAGDDGEVVGVGDPVLGAVEGAGLRVL
jgi:hypothetical protein